MSKINAHRSHTGNVLFKRSSKVLAAAVAGAGLCNTLLASSATWTFNGFNGSWGDAANWLGGVPATGVDSTADFSGIDLIGDRQITVEAPKTIGNIIFGDTIPGTSGNWLVNAGSTITLDVTAGAPAITVNAMGAGSTVEIATSIAGNDGLTKAGVGTLILSATNTYSGALSVTGGVLSLRGAGAIGSASSVTLAGGNIELHSDADTTYTQSFTINNNASILVDQNTSATGPNRIHTIGAVSLGGTGTRTVTVTNGNDYALTTGLVSAADSAVFLNNSTKPLTLGGYNALSAGASTLTLNGTGSAVLNGTVSSTGGGTLTVAHTGATTLTINAAMNNANGATRVTGGGTLVFGPGATLPSASSLVVTSGLVDLSGSGAVTHSIGSMTLGSVGNATISTGGATLAVSGDITRAAGNSIPVVSGNLNLGATAHTITVNGDSLQIAAATSGSGSIVKAGAGSLALTSANNLSAAVTVNTGTVSGSALGSGNALSSGAHVLNGGVLELLGGGSAGAGTIGAVTFGDTGSPRLSVNANGGQPTTLNIGALNGRVGGTKGTLTLVPSQGSLDTNEIFNMISAPTLTNGIVPAHTVLQQSSGDTTLDFIGLSGSHLVKATYSGSTGPTSVFNATSGLTVAGTQSVFALRNPGQTIDGSGTLVVGDDTNPGGIIMNGGQITTANLSFGTLGNSEGIVWGGNGGGNINSAITLKNTLTTAGPGNLTFGGPINLNGATQTLNTTGTGTTTINGQVSNGSITKTGGNGTLLLNGNNSSYSGVTTISAGTLGVGTTGALGSGAVNNAAALSFIPNNGDITVSNTITGAGNIYQNGGQATVLSSNLSGFTGLTVVNSGILRAGVANLLPTANTLQVNGGNFDLNGLAQSVGVLTGSGGSISTNIAGTTTLTLNSGTYGGVITNGTGTLALLKAGTGSITLTQVTAHTGGTNVTGGTLSTTVVNGVAGAITLDGGAINMANNGNNTFNVAVTSNGGTISYSTAGGTFAGGATMATGAVLTMAANGLNVNFSPNTGSFGALSGTLRFADSGGDYRMFGTNGTLNAANLLVDLGNGTTSLHPRAGTFQFAMGALTGGPNTQLSGTSVEVAGRPANWVVGSLNTSTTFQGRITTGFASMPHTLTKVGTGSLTLTGAGNNYNGATAVNAGVLEIGSGGSVTGTPTITIANGATFMISGTGTLSAASVLNTGASSLATGRFNVAGMSSTFTTASGLTLSGNGTIVGSVIHSAGIINAGGLTGPGTLSFSSNLSLSGGLVGVDVTGGAGAGVVGAGTNDLLKVAGNLTLSAGTVSVNWLAGGIPANGTDYPILTFGGTQTGLLSSLSVASSLPGTFSLVQPTPGTIAVHVSSIVVPHNSLSWKGNLSTTWDVNLTSNWIDTGHGNVAAKFVPGDNLTFDDTASTGSINVTTVVSPDSMVFNNSGTAYSLNGLGTVTGATGIVKNNTGNVTINNVNTFTGGITINGGTVLLSNTGAGGSGSITLNTGGALQFAQSFTANQVNVAGNSSLNFGAVNNTTYSGTFSGNSTINFTSTGLGGGTPTLLANLDQSNYSAFTGTINVSGLPNGVALRLSVTNPTIDFSNAFINLGDNSNGFQSRSNTNMLIGALAGGPSSQLIGAQAANSGLSTFTIGTLNQSTTFSGNINDSGSINLLSVVKVGTGTLTLGGSISNTGVTQVDGGVLEVTGNFSNAGNVNINTGTLLLTNIGGLGGNKVVNVNAAGILDLSAGGFNTSSGVTLAGSGGHIKGNVNHNSGTIAAGGLNTLGTLNFDNDLSLSGGTMSFDLTADTTPGGTTNDLINVAGNFDMSSGNVVINFLGNSAANGSVYKLVGFATKTGAATNLNLVNNTRAALSLSDSVAGQLSLNVVTSSVGANVKWVSTGDSNWDVNQNQNWLNTGTSNPDKFFNGDSVLFNDDTSGVQTTINIPSSVVPTSVTVNSTASNYTFNGPGQITGTAGLLKQGGSTLTLSGNNSYSGGTQVQGGTLVLGTSASAGTGSIAMSGTSNLSLAAGAGPSNRLDVSGDINVYMTPAGAGTYAGQITGNGKLTINKPTADQVTLAGDMSTFSGTLSFGASIGSFRLNNGGTNVNTGSPTVVFDFGTGSASLVNRNGGAFNLGGLTGGTTTTLSGASDAAGILSTFNIGSANIDTTFAGSIIDAAAAPRLTAINKVGTGSLTLSGTLSYTGGTTVTLGKLIVTGKLPNGPVTINGGLGQIAAKGTPNSAPGTSVVPSLAVTGGALDLTNNSMVIDYSGPVSTQVSDVRGFLRTSGLISSSSTTTTRLGYGDNALLNKATFGGVGVDSSSILIKYTYAGDADLDGDADGVDIGTWATNFTGELGGLGSSVWTQGDWDYDGDVDGVDAGLWAQAFTGELGGGGLGSLVVNDPTIAPGAAAILRGMGITVVPEPASLGLLGALAACSLGRRRRRA